CRAIAEIIFRLINLKANGTFHFASCHPVSWYEFALAIVKEASAFEDLMVENISPILSENYKTLAKRPAYSVLDCEKIKSLGIKQPDWQDDLSAVICENNKEITPC